MSASFAYIALGTVAALTIIARLSKRRSLDAIPTVGSNGWLDSWWAGQRFQTNAVEVVQEGYEKYNTAPFKVADRYNWTVILSSRQHIEELRKASDDSLSLMQAIRESIEMDYTMGPEMSQNLYHIEVIRSQLTRSISDLYPEIRDEISVAFDEVLDLKDREWKGIHALGSIQKVVSRTSNRLFVGLPLCRDPDWTDLSIRYTLDVVNGAHIIQRYPEFLAPLIAWFITDVAGTTKRAVKHLGPMIEERLRLQEQYGREWDGQPNDLLSWLLDNAPEGPERTVKLLTGRILIINFAAIHTSSSSFCQALFFLAANPQYIQPLREEVESIVKSDGWSKASLGKMHKIDSFLRESQRLVGIASASMARVAMKDYTFSDGTFIPKGTTILAPSLSLHLDDKHYANAREFDPFRFSDMRSKEGEEIRHQFVSTSPEYLPFGHGKHACPGRFFAANELKTMLAHVVTTYDVKLEENTARPEGFRIGLSTAPDPTAKVMFRRRAH